MAGLTGDTASSPDPFLGGNRAIAMQICSQRHGCRDILPAKNWAKALFLKIYMITMLVDFNYRDSDFSAPAD